MDLCSSLIFLLAAVASRTSYAFAPNPVRSSVQSTNAVNLPPHSYVCRSLGRLHAAAANSPYERFGRMRDGWWENMFALLERYRDMQGHADVPYTYWCRLDGSFTSRGGHDDEDMVNLGRWLRKQRKSRNTGTLSTWKQSKLDELGVDWDANPALRDAYTITVSSDLSELSTRYGRWKRSFSSSSLGAGRQFSARSVQNWIEEMPISLQARRSRFHAKNRRNTGKKVRWDVIKEGWCPGNDDPILGTWEQMYALLMQFKIREGHCNVPRDHREDGVELGGWLAQQRRAKMREILVPDWQRRLDELDVGWSSGTGADNAANPLQKSRKNPPAR